MCVQHRNNTSGECNNHLVLGTCMLVCLPASHATNCGRKTAHDQCGQLQVHPAAAGIPALQQCSRCRYFLASCIQVSSRGQCLTAAAASQPRQQRARTRQPHVWLRQRPQVLCLCQHLMASAALQSFFTCSFACSHTKKLQYRNSKLSSSCIPLPTAAAKNSQSLADLHPNLVTPNPRPGRVFGTLPHKSIENFARICEDGHPCIA